MSQSRRSARIVVGVLVLGSAALWSAEDVAPALPPEPMTVPLPPTAQAAVRDDDDALLQRIDAQVQTRDQRISEMLKDGVTPNPTAGRTPRLSTEDANTLDVLKAHAEARTALRKALEEAAKRGGRATEDVLDRGRPRVQAAQTGPLSAQNQIAIAECFKDLAGGPDGTAEDLAGGLAALNLIDAGRLPETERPRLLYLALWFELEHVRRLKPGASEPERLKHLTSARERQAELLNQFPTSPLAQTAEALFAGLEAK